MTVARLFDAVSQAQDKGLAGEVSVLVSPKLYAQLLGEAEGTVQKDYSYKKQDFEGGFKGVTLTSYTGDIILVPHRYIKRSECFVLELDELVQVGATKLVEKLEGKMVPSFMLDAPNGLYQESRLFANFNLVMKAPAHMLKVKNIGYDS